MAFFLIVTKTIKYCLDPKNEIFIELDRFKIIEKINLKKIAIIGIPNIIITSAIIVFIISLGLQSCIVLFNKIRNGYTEYFVYHYPIHYFWIDLLFCLIIIIIASILGICILYYFWLFFLQNIKLFVPIYNLISLKICNIYESWGTLNNLSDLRDTRFYIWIQDHWKFFLLLFIILLILIYCYDFIWPCDCNNSGCICIG